MAIHLTKCHDPQVRGNACQLVGNLLRSMAGHILVSPALLSERPQLTGQLLSLIDALDGLLANEVLHSLRDDDISPYSFSEGLLPSP